MEILEYFRQKGGFHPIYRDFIKKNWEYFGIFRQKGGGLANSEISLSEKTGASELLRGEGGSQNFGVFLKKKNCFFSSENPETPPTPSSSLEGPVFSEKEILK